MNKIYGSKTENESGENLCATCSNHHVIKSANTEMNLCSNYRFRLHSKIFECSAYDDARLTGQGAMNEVAYRWVPELKRFLSPSQFHLFNMFGSCAPRPAQQSLPISEEEQVH